MSLTVISLPDTCMHAGNEMACVIETSLPLSTDNLEILCGINVELVYGSTTFSTLVTRRLQPDSNRQCRFFIHQFLWDAFQEQYDLPPVGGTSMYQLQHAIRKYTLFAIEYSGDPQSVTHLLSTGTIAQQRFAAKGAIAKARFALRGFFGTSGWNALPTASGGLGRAFLDWRGLKPRTRLTEDQWLHFHWQDPTGVVGPAALQYLIRWYRSDGTNGGITIATPVMQLQDVYALPAGFTQLGLSSYETATEKIYRYTTWISVNILGTPTPLSEVKNWQVDRDYYEFVIQLQYLNSLGVMEQLTLRGARTTTFNIEKERIDAYRDSTYDADQGESTVFDVLVENGFVALSGAGTAQEAKQFADLKASRNVFLLSASSGQSNIPVRVKAGTHQIDSLQNTYTYSIEIVQDFKDQVPDLIG